MSENSDCDLTLATLISQEIAKIDIRHRPRQYAQEILKVICENLSFHFASILLVDDDGRGRIFSAYNLPKNYPEAVHKISAPVLSSPSGAAIENRKSIIVNDISNEPRLGPWHELLTQYNIQTIAWIPLFSKGKAIGTCNLYDNDKKEVTETELSILNQLSGLFSLAIIGNEYIDEIREQSLRLESEIAERKKVEDQLRVAIDKAETANKAKSEFLTAMTHELRTPMNAIIGFTEILMHDEKKSDRADTLKIVLDASETLLNLIDSILEFSEIESGTVELNIRPFEVKDLLDEIYHHFAAKAERKKLTFHVGIINEPPVPVRLMGDVYRVEQVIGKIVDNAIKFTEEGDISVEFLYLSDEWIAEFRIIDTGIGIPADKFQEVLSAFSQADMSLSRSHEGIGLGLTISSRLVNHMGGTITLDSTPGKGTIFAIRLNMPPAD